MARRNKKLDSLHPKLRVAWSSVHGLVRGQGKGKADAEKAADRVADLLTLGLRDAGINLDAQEEWHVHNSLAHPLVQFLNESDLEQVGEALHTMTLPPDGVMAEPGAFAAWLVGAIEAAMKEIEASEEDPPEGSPANDTGIADGASKPKLGHRLAAAAAVVGVLAGGPKLDAGTSWRADRIACELDAPSRRAIDRALEIAATDSDKSDMAELARVADGLRSDGFNDYVTPEGYLRVKVRAARTGTQVYSDGFTTWGEYRDWSEVFSTASLESWGLKPFTNDHPPEWVGIDNWAIWAKGTVGQDARRDSSSNDGDEYVLVTIQISDIDTLLSIRDGKLELSAGYSCRIQTNPGRDSKGREYRYTQHDIFINHLSLVDRGRAGPLARVSLDGFAWQVLATTTDTTDTNMPTPNLIKVQLADGITVELTKDQADQYDAARKAEIDKAAKQVLADAEAAKLAADNSTATAAKLDTLESKVSQLLIDKATTDAELAVAKQQAADAIARQQDTERANLVTQVKGLCPKLSIDANATVTDIRAAATIYMNPGYKPSLDKYPKTDDAKASALRDTFVKALFDAEVLRVGTSSVNDAPTTQRETSAPATRVPSRDAINAMAAAATGRVAATA